MLEQLRVALKSYDGELARGVVVLCLLWLAFIAWFSQGGYLSPLDYFRLLGSVLFVSAGGLGLKLRSQLVPCRAKLLPNWNAAHLLVALGLSVLFAMLVIGVTMISLGGSLSPDVLRGNISYAGLFGFFWFAALLCFAAAYFSHPVSVILLPVAIGVAGFGGDGFLKLFSLFAYRGHPVIVSMLIVINATASIVLIRRILQVDEEASERRWNFTLDPREQQRRAWVSENRNLWMNNWLWSRMNHALDSIPHPLNQALHSQVRHFQLGVPGSSTIRIFTIVLTLLFWLVNMVTRGHLVDGNASFFMITFVPINTIFVGLLFSQRHSLQWIFMLPYRRSEIAIRYGGALLVSVLRLWLSISVAIFVVQWMPVPGTIRGLPPLLPFVESLALLFPLFGIVTMLLMRPTGTRAVKAFGSIALWAVLTIAIAIVFAKVTGRYDPEPAFTIAALITGPALIWFSYRSWLQADLN